MIPSRRAFLRKISTLWPLTLSWPAQAAETSSAPFTKNEKTILFFGDSLTAGYGLAEPATESYPARLGEKLLVSYPNWKMINGGLSGETTSGGLRRIDWVLRQPVTVFFLALGGNDGLRGIPTTLTKANLETIIAKVRAKNPQVVIVLAGMKMPISMGTYAADFAAVYPAIANTDKELTLLPFLLEGVGGIAALNQNDAIHPNREGHLKVAEHVWPVLEPLIKAAH